ncbi:hypothetical protein OMCYN_01868 [cyanobiont of Ornithocercus magnificus]|nr:hypothetical protein OMCYN_01868 [cyanobiont of Ornithocercus magnificus]
MESSEHKGIFHYTAEELFTCLDIALNRYRSGKAKQIEDVFFLILGLNHLREWIAPGYDHKQEAKSTEQKFYNEIFKNNDFKIIRQLSNNAKHLLKNPMGTSRSSGLSIDDYPPIDEVSNFDEGPPSGFYVEVEIKDEGKTDEKRTETKDVGEVLQNLLEIYRKWFQVQRKITDD